MSSYQIYQTKGIVLYSLNIGEANKYLYIFTDNFGLIVASAQGLRNIRSKLRYGLQDFSFSDISLVKGKEIWRITNVAPIGNLCLIFKKEKEKLFIIIRILSLLRRLLKGEEKNRDLFEIVYRSIDFLMKVEDNCISNFESIVVMRILNNLGYFNKDDLFDDFIGLNNWSDSLLVEFGPLRELSIKRINQALKETHL